MEVCPVPVAIFQALFVTLLWSSSWAFIKVGLEDIPPLTFAGLRYALAFLSLLPLLSQPRRRAALRTLTRRDWGRLAALGLLLYAITQGAQFVGLAYLPAQTMSLFLSFSVVMVALLGATFLDERLRPLQAGGVALYLAGALIFLHPVALPAGQLPGVAAALVAVLANAGSAVLGRSVNRAGTLDPVTVTLLSMGVGATALLVAGLLAQGLPALSLRSWGIIAWLAVVNTALAFTLWNVTLRTLSATASSLINNTMLIQIALLAWLFLGESLGAKEVSGLGLAALGVLAVQLFVQPNRKV
jgi:drug/metabolite transporter (DMT)-like permease